MGDYGSTVESFRVNSSRIQLNKQQPPLRLLSLDGGGIRGYSMIMILQDLMVKLFVEAHKRVPKKEEIPKPCDHFDLIGGTGAGGLIAILVGRLRLDLEACKEVYVKMTKKVFEADKTIAGLPYRKTLFKASKLEEFIKEVVRETSMQDGEETVNMFIDPKSPIAQVRPRRRQTSDSLAGSSDGGRSENMLPLPGLQWGNENALLYDLKAESCKTFVTAVYKGSGESPSPALLRSYDSAHGTSVLADCTIWEAGRATCAISPAFKQIQIGQKTFLDEGSGRYSPVVQVLEEALASEWPGREVGLLVSVGSGRSPDGETKKETSGIVAASPFGKFIEAREAHIARVVDCEDIHREVLEGIQRIGVKKENYFRLNVEDDGITAIGMNERSKLGEISAYTKKYLARPEIQKMNTSAAANLAEIHRKRKEHRGLEILNRELPDLPIDAFDSDSEEEDEEVTRCFEEIYRIKAKIQA